MKDLLKLLEKNARLSAAELAAMLDKSEAEIASQLEKLEKTGVIKGYTTVINWEKVGADHVTALIELGVSPKKDSGFDEIAQEIAEFEEVESVKLMSGGFDLAVSVRGATFQDIAMFVAKKLSTIDAVLSTSTLFELRVYKDNGVYITEEEIDLRGMTL